MDICYSSWRVNNPASHFDVWLLVCVGSSNYCPCYRLQLSVCDKNANNKADFREVLTLA